MDMKSLNNKLLLSLAAFLFVTAVSSDPLIHDHLDSSNSTVECEYCENKTFDASEAKTQVDNTFISELTSCEVKKNFHFPVFSKFSIKSSTKKLNF